MVREPQCCPTLQQDPPRVCPQVEHTGPVHHCGLKSFKNRHWGPEDCLGSRPGVAVASSSLQTVPYKARRVRRSFTAAVSSRKMKALCVFLRAPRQHGSEWRACKYSVNWCTSHRNAVSCASASQVRYLLTTLIRGLRVDVATRTQRNRS